MNQIDGKPVGLDALRDYLKHERENLALQTEVVSESMKLETMSPEARDAYLARIRENAKGAEVFRVGSSQVLSLDHLLKPTEDEGGGEPTDDEPEADPDVSDGGQWARHMGNIGPDFARESRQWDMAYKTASTMMKFTLKQMIYFVLSRIMRVNDAKIARMAGVSKQMIFQMRESMRKIFEKSLGK